MNEDAFNMSIRKFLKTVGVTSQREIEQAVEERPGRYVLPSFDFDVGGEWLLTVTARTDVGISQTRDFRVSVFGEP